MCGIAGFFDANMRPDDKASVVRAMARKIEHRGPDGEGFFCDTHIALGHKRLSIIDLETGDQPMISADGNKIVVYNGEIYNYRELKEELRDYPFRTQSDTEVLLAGYEKWGEALPLRLRGMFAFAIYEKDARKLFLARDPFGIKPLYWYEADGTFLFASEIKAFYAHPKFRAQLDETLLSAYMSFSFTPTTETFFKGVRRLDAGHTMIVDESGTRSPARYFTPTFSPQETTLEEAAERVGEAMKNSVKCHMIADVEVGSFLSGGVDSSYLVTLAHPAKTFTVGYEDARYSEIVAAADLAALIKTGNRAHKIEPEEYVRSIDDALYYMDEPSSDPAIVSLYHVAKLAARDVKVVLSGEGADEFFGGYNTYRTLYEYGWYDKVPFALRHAVAAALSHTPPFRGRNFLVRRGQRLEDNYVGISRVFEENEIKNISRVPITRTTKDVTAPVFALYQGESDLNRMQAIDLHFWLVKDILHKADRMTMAHSLESRTPFTDIEAFKVAASLPASCKVTNTETKAALRAAAKRVVPNEAYARKKLGFPVPVREWMREEPLYTDIREAFSTEIAETFFDAKRLRAMLEAHRDKKADYYRKIWNVYVFLRWHNAFFERGK